jgi:cytochrome c peroxidase
MTPGDAAGVAPLFTDFTSSNLGLPKNVAIPYYYETTPDSFGFTPNPRGLAFIDRAVGDFLRGPLNPNAAWTQYADRFDGKIQNQAIRNVDMRPSPEFVKAYMHHGYLKNLKEVVHFSNTRDILRPCGPGKIEKVTCWPPPEVPQNVNKTIGNLGLNSAEEDQLVAFLKTLTDGYTLPADKNLR